MNNQLRSVLAALSVAALAAGSLSAQSAGGPPEDIEEGPALHAGGHPGADLADGEPGEAGFGAGRGRGMQFHGMKGGPGMKGRGGLAEAEAAALIKKHDPAFASRLEALKTASRPRYRMAVMMAARALAPARMEEDESLEKEAVSMAALEFSVRELALRYEKAADADKAGVKAEIKARVSELFDLRLKAQAARIARMEKDLAKFRSGLEARKANRAKIIDERVSRLTGEGYGW